MQPALPCRVGLAEPRCADARGFGGLQTPRASAGQFWCTPISEAIMGHAIGIVVADVLSRRCFISSCRAPAALREEKKKILFFFSSCNVFIAPWPTNKCPGLKQQFPIIQRSTCDCRLGEEVRRTEPEQGLCSCPGKEDFVIRSTLRLVFLFHGFSGWCKLRYGPLA